MAPARPSAYPATRDVGCPTIVFFDAPTMDGQSTMAGCGWETEYDAEGATLQGYVRGCLSRWSWGWALLTPALLATLVVTGTFGEGDHLKIDEKALGVGAATLALTLRAPVLLAVILAALVTALARLFRG